MTEIPDARSVDHPLRAVLHVTPDPKAACSVVSAGAPDEQVSLNGSISGGDSVGTACHADVTVDDGDREQRRLVSDAANDHCICPAFSAHRCVAAVERVLEDAVVVRLSVPDRETLRDVVADLRERDADVELARLDADTAAERTLELDAGDVTDAQREAIRVAERLGYYEDPREADLGDVAGELGISRSAASQRLNGAASTLVLELLRTEADRDDRSA
ncbi:helix-turn-helix domain-containing protein [Natronoarchaeum rubrum]|uniref:helix-turn-helix domain-containing protein n=1 Tax=Natronoarchaeum rubrum TaxID=755311 RepID=UPI002113387D|nr:helix-turn-helix domain-containing protein [Natronoarchaeum rubrum]